MSNPAPTTIGLQAARLRVKILEARQEIAFWERQKILRATNGAKAEAGARVLAWRSTLAERETRLSNLLIGTV